VLHAFLTGKMVSEANTIVEKAEDNGKVASGGIPLAEEKGEFVVAVVHVALLTPGEFPSLGKLACLEAVDANALIDGRGTPEIETQVREPDNLPAIYLHAVGGSSVPVGKEFGHDMT